jgi:hypothetical protein
MVLLAAMREADAQPDSREPLTASSFPTKDKFDAGAHHPCSKKPPSRQSVPVRPEHVSRAPDAPLATSNRLCQPTSHRKSIRHLAAEEMTHEQILAAYEAKQEAFAAHHRHDHAALTSPELRELLPPLQLMQPWLQYQTQLPVHRQPSERLNSALHSTRALTKSGPRCIMPGVLHQLAQEARLDLRLGSTLRPPSGSTAPRKRSTASAQAAKYKKMQQDHLKRQRVTAVHMPLNCRQALVAAGKHQGPSQLLHGLRCLPSRAVDTSPMHSFFSRRSRELRAKGSHSRALPREPSTAPSVGLLALPQEVLVTAPHD